MAEKQSLDSIQILRGIAALSVVFHHACTMVLDNGDRPALVNQIGLLRELGAAGVDIFFVISGFIMVYVARDSFGRPGAALLFWKKRLLRIFPLYWVYTTAMVLLVLSPFAMKHAVFSLSYTLKSYLLIPAFNPTSTDHLPQPLLPAGWTLSYEMFFYLIFGLWIWIGTLRTLVPFILGCFGASLALSRILPGDTAIGAFLGLPVMFEFFYGIVVGLAFLHGRTAGPKASMLCILVATAAFATTIFFRPELTMGWLVWGLPAALLIYGALGFNSPKHRITSALLKLGDASYTLYLLHAFVILAVGGFLKRKIIVHLLPPDLLIVLVVFACAGLGLLAYQYFELPMNLWLARKFATARKPIVPASAIYPDLNVSGPQLGG